MLELWEDGGLVLSFVNDVDARGGQARARKRTRGLVCKMTSAGGGGGVELKWVDTKSKSSVETKGRYGRKDLMLK